MSGLGGGAARDEGIPEPGATALVDVWLAGLARSAYVPMDRSELHRFLCEATARLAAAAGAEPPDLPAARRVGASLVDADLVAAEALPATVAALALHLDEVVRAADVAAPSERAAGLQGAVAEGYTTRLRTRLLDEQEMVRRAEIRAREDAESALRASEARFRAIFRNAGIGIGIADLQGRIVDANEAFASMLGYTVEEFCRLRVGDFVYPDDAPGMWDLYRGIIDGEIDTAQVQKRYRHRDGHLVWTELTASLIRDASGTPLYTVAMAEDITARRELQERLRMQALHDPLTGLPNRAFVQERLAAVFSRPTARIGVCYLDLDRFKAVNDRLGHDVGDRLLLAVAERLDRCVSRRGHLVGRMGGDEFVILAEDPPDGELAHLAEAVLEVLAAPVDLGEHRLVVSGSIGVVESPVAATTPADVMKSADVTLYWAKADGRNRWARFDPERSARDMTRYTLSTTLLPGLEREEFRVEFQPIVGLADGRTQGVEALVRWEHPEFGRLGPDHFIDLAEENGAIVPLGLRVLGEACERAAEWNAAHPHADLFVSVNLAVRQAQEPGLVEEVAAILDKTGLAPQLLQLELTESALLGPAGHPVASLAALAGIGVRIAVDDFGTGYSNLSYLPRLPLHTLKLAGVLVGGLDGPGHTSTVPIVRSIVGLAHALGIQVTAEGVERRSQADHLITCGCDSAQGWLYARPAPWAALVPRLDAGAEPTATPAGGRGRRAVPRTR
jgi:diguanylate cyclase (GGDEF)-like protein/PAS domain S-box-containing protein